MTSVLKVDTIQNSSGGTASATGLGIGASDYLSVVFPASGSTSVSSIDSTSDFSSYATNNISVSSVASGSSGADVFTYFTQHTLSGLTNGVYEFNVHFSMDRTSNASIIQLVIYLEEDGTKEVYAYDETVTQGYGACSFSVIRDYTSSLPSSILIGFETDKDNYIVPKGAGYTIKRLG